jgi:hypothetical protein
MVISGVLRKGPSTWAKVQPWDQTQGLSHAKPVLYHWAISPVSSWAKFWRKGGSKLCRKLKMGISSRIPSTKAVCQYCPPSRENKVVWLAQGEERGGLGMMKSERQREDSTGPHRQLDSECDEKAKQDSKATSNRTWFTFWWILLCFLHFCHLLLSPLFYL